MEPGRPVPFLPPPPPGRGRAWGTNKRSRRFGLLAAAVLSASVLKWYPHQESIRVSLIVRDPRMAPAMRGQTNDKFVLNVDLAPTIAAAAGIAAQPAMQGRDLGPLYLATPEPAWRTEFFYEHPVITSSSRSPASQCSRPRPTCGPRPK